MRGVLGGKGPPGGRQKGPTKAASIRGPETSKLKNKSYTGGQQSRKLYWRLLTERFGQGPLEPFVCDGCGVIALDSVGWNGRRQPLCDACADGTERELWRP